jgi:regulator of protease activity HflC (stomatin/prohibitin superfamily)
MSIGELVKQILEWVYAFWPMRIIHDWEQGVRCLFGNAKARLTSSNGLGGTGLHFFWPGLQEIEVCDTNIEVVETDLQTHTSLDGAPVTFSMGLKYRITNLMRMYKSIHDARETIYNEISSVAGWCVGQMDYEAIRHDLCEHVLRETKEQMGEWGIEVMSLHLINMSEAKPLRLIMNRGASSVQDSLD